MPWTRPSATSARSTIGLAAGKFAICLGCREIDEAKSQGLPVDHFEMGEWKEGEPLSTGGGSLGLMRGAPHPNAARVFNNWFLSRKGQTALQMSNDLLGAQPPYSRRIDIPKEMLPPGTRLVPGWRYLDLTLPEFTDLAPMDRLLKEILKSR